MLSGAQRSRSISTASLQFQQLRKHHQNTKAVAMTYTKRRFAAELLAELERDLAEAEPAFSVLRLARWASTKHFKYQGHLEAGLEDSIMTIMLMEEGEEFELDIHQVRSLAIATLSIDI